MARLTLKNVRKRYDSFEAVRGVSLEIADGEFLVLVGPSGCGKSTTLRMIAGLEEISEGTISIGERVVNDVHPKDRDIAMVFQNYALYPHMTVEQNLAFALRLRRTPKAEIRRRVDEAARMLGIEPLLKRKPRQLSGGQRQRVAVGRAIVREPAAFLFDEPLSNLDAKLRVTTRAELKALHQRLRTTTVYVTHDQEEAMTLGDRIVVMAEGLIQQQGAPYEVYHAPANRFVASFIGTPPMNFFEGGLTAHGNEGVRFVSLDGGISLLVAEEHAPELQTRERVVLGLRPQAIELSERAEPGLTIEAEVQVVELLGDQMDLTCNAAGSKLVARVRAQPDLNPGMRVHLAPERARACYFAPGEFGESLLKSAGATVPA